MEIITKKKDLSTAPIYQSLSTFSISECINVSKACLKFHTSAPWYHKCNLSHPCKTFFFEWYLHENIRRHISSQFRNTVEHPLNIPWFPSFHVQLQWSKSIISAENYIHVRYSCLVLKSTTPKRNIKRGVCRKMVY